MNPKLERQLRLKEVGLYGQARLDVAKVGLRVPQHESPSIDHWVAEQYLHRAGVTKIESTAGPDFVDGQPLDRTTFAHKDDFRQKAALEIAEGADRALRLIRKILD